MHAFHVRFPNQEFIPAGAVITVTNGVGMSAKRHFIAVAPQGQYRAMYDVWCTGEIFSKGVWQCIRQAVPARDSGDKLVQSYRRWSRLREACEKVGYQKTTILGNEVPMHYLDELCIHAHDDRDSDWYIIPRGGEIDALLEYVPLSEESIQKAQTLDAKADFVAAQVASQLSEEFARLANIVGISPSMALLSDGQATPFSVRYNISWYQHEDGQSSEYMAPRRGESTEEFLWRTYRQHANHCDAELYAARILFLGSPYFALNLDHNRKPYWETSKVSNLDQRKLMKLRELLKHETKTPA